ncbi:MAG: hypothetical protein PHE55_19635 [Methylococcaceae bacterium]|nr:hypothetical protein [Methylococcaceae bacterium]
MGTSAFSDHFGRTPQERLHQFHDMSQAFCRDAGMIGEIQAGPARVVLETRLGGERILEELEDDPLPRIC